MTIWGPGIFDNSVSRGVRDEFAKHVNDGLSVYAAADRILNQPRNPLEESSRPQIVLALAACQLEHGVIQPKLKKQALTAIILGEDDESWNNAGAEIAAERKRVLQELRERLAAE